MLTKEGSSKKTYHIALDIQNAKLSFKVGDSIAILPTNNPEIVDEILHKLKATGLEEIIDPKSGQTCIFRDFLLYKANISKASFHKLLPVERTTLPLLDLVKNYQPHPNELCKVLLPLMPRFYSIASSQKVFPDELHLTVALAGSLVNGTFQYGVGSYFLCEQAELESTSIPIYVQPSNHFTLPDPSAPIILIGPGTGIAPFRAFLQERIATQAAGLNWIFFGERNRDTDFYYSDFWLDLEKQNRIRLDLAFSRDQEEKIYVQHKLFEHRKAIWNWISQKGAYIYVCGDAQKMAKDVDLTLQQIIHEEAKTNEEDARKFLKSLRLEKRYLLDVY